MKKCCFTGHRPRHLPWGYDENHPMCQILKEKLKNEITLALYDGYTYFITGMAEGFDTIALETLYKLKLEGYDIFIEGAIPCMGQEEKWSKKSQLRYKENLEKLDKITFISNEFTSSCMQDRNDYMLENCERVIACFLGRFGGTSSTLTKAKNLGKEIILIDNLEKD